MKTIEKQQRNIVRIVLQTSKKNDLRSQIIKQDRLQLGRNIILLLYSSVTNFKPHFSNSYVFVRTWDYILIKLWMKANIAYIFHIVYLSQPVYVQCNFCFGITFRTYTHIEGMLHSHTSIKSFLGLFRPFKGLCPSWNIWY